MEWAEKKLLKKSKCYLLNSRIKLSTVVDKPVDNCRFNKVCAQADVVGLI
jgi:hypothetical protein